MLGLIQLVTHANVKIERKIVGEIQRGIMALIGIEKNDTEDNAKKIIKKIINYRIFPDENGKTNLSLKDVNGGLLLVPQFTLVAETQKGLRPGFSRGMPPAECQILFEFLVNHAVKNYHTIAAGQFGAYMQVALCNDGPVTYLLQN